MGAVAALAIVALLFWAVASVLRVALRTAFFVALILVGAFFVFNIRSGQIWTEVNQIWGYLSQMIGDSLRWGLNAFLKLER